jgi:heat shock protein HslJ
MKRIPFVFLIPVIIISCQPTKTPSHEISTVEKDLRDIWVLTFMANTAVDSTTFPMGRAQLEINPIDSSIVGSTGCNNLVGTMIAAGQDSLRFGPLATTKKYCMGVAEAQFLDCLTQTVTYAREGLELTFYNDSMAVLKFKKVD